MAIAAALPWWVALAALMLLAGMVVWANLREDALQASQTRLTQAEERAAIAETMVAVQAQSQAATATTLEQASSPGAAVDRSLSVLLAAERDPTDEHLRALNDSFGPAALSMVRPEVEHLLSGGLHLGGDSAFELSVQSTGSPATDQAAVRTRERWTYDERMADDQRARCLVETSDQTYSLQRAGTSWQIVDMRLETSTRVNC